MTPTPNQARQILEKTLAGISLLHNRNWPDIAARLDEEDEFVLSYKVKITLREGEPGQHADKDHRVQTTISFAKRFSDSTESALEDPQQGSLPLDGPVPKRFTEIDLRDRALREYPDTDAMLATFLEIRKLNGVFAEDDDKFRADFAEFERAIREKIEARSAPEGGDIEAGQGQTPVGDALDKAALEAPAAKLEMRLPKLPLKSAFAFGREFRKAAKAAGWPEVQVAPMLAHLETLQSPEEKIAFLAPHIAVEKVRVTTDAIDREEQNMPAIEPHPFRREHGFAFCAFCNEGPEHPSHVAQEPEIDHVAAEKDLAGGPSALPVAPSKPEELEVNCVPVPRVPLALLPQKWAAERIRVEWRKAARKAGWQDREIEHVDYQAQKAAEEFPGATAADEIAAGEAARKVLVAYCYNPSKQNADGTQKPDDSDLPL